MVEVSRFLGREDARATRVIPLSMRLPNAPAVYIPTGKEEALSRALARHRVIQVSGPERVGKRSIVAHVLHAHPDLSLERTIWLDASAQDEPLEIIALRALATLSDAQIPWATLIGSPRLAIELLVDLSDALELCVVCSRAELERADAVARDRFFDALASYCRRARWVFLERTSRPPGHALSHGVLCLSAPDEAMRSRWLSEVAPWLEPRQHQSLAQSAGGWDALMRGLEQIGVDESLRPQTARAITPQCVPEDKPVHARGALLGELEAALEEDPARGASLLEAELEALIERGHAASVLSLLDATPVDNAASLEIARMRCLLACRDREALGKLVPPANNSQEVMAWWARVLLERGEMEEARRALSGAPETLDVKIIAAHIALSQQSFHELYEVASGTPGVSSSKELWLESLLLLGMVWDGRRERALERSRARAHELLRRPEGSLDRDARHAAINLARALHLLEELSLSSRLIERVQVGEHSSDWSFYDSDSLDYFRALLATETLELERARAILERMLPWFDVTHGLGLHIRLLLGHVEIRSGHDERGLAYLDALLDAPHATELHASARVTRARCIAATQGFAVAPSLGDTAHSAHVARSEQEYASERAIRLLGATDDMPAENPFIHALARVLLGEDADLEALEHERERARCQGLEARAWILSQRLGMLYICAGRFDAATVAWRAASEASALAGNQPLADAEASMAALVSAEPGTLAPARLVAWYTEQPASRYKRVLGAVLGYETPDLFEALVARKLCESRLLWSVARRDADGAPTWWFDLERSLAIQPYAALELSARTRQGQLFHALCKRGGEATKAELLRDVWGIEEHHPLRDENRLRMAAHKLKRALEGLTDGDPIRATDDGYRVSDQCRWVVGEIKGNQG